MEKNACPILRVLIGTPEALANIRFEQKNRWRTFL